MTDRIDDFDDDDDVISIELGVSRRNLMKQLGVAGLVGGLAGCSSLRSTGTNTQTELDSGSTSGSNEDAGQDSGPEAPAFKRVDLVPPPSADSIDNASPNDSERRMVLVNQNGENQFWVPCTNGLNDALNKLGWKGQMLAPNGYDETKQVEILNTTIDSLESSRDVIGSTIMGPEAYADPVKKALDNDIMFFQWNTTHPDWTPAEMRERFERVIPYVGQRAYRSGWAVGTTAQEKAAEVFGKGAELTVLPTLSVPGHPALENRIRGVRDSFKGRGDVTVLDTLDISTDIAKGTNRIQDKYNAEEFNVRVAVGSGAPPARPNSSRTRGSRGTSSLAGSTSSSPSSAASRTGRSTSPSARTPTRRGTCPSCCPTPTWTGASCPRTTSRVRKSSTRRTSNSLPSGPVPGRTCATGKSRTTTTDNAIGRRFDRSSHPARNAESGSPADLLR